MNIQKIAERQIKQNEASEVMDFTANNTIIRDLLTTIEQLEQVNANANIELEKSRLLNTLCNYSLDRDALCRDLTEAFVVREYHAQINPVQSDFKESAVMLYRSNPMFHARVQSVVSGVMQIVQNYLP